VRRRSVIVSGVVVVGLALAAGAFVASAYFFDQTQRNTIAKGVVVAGVPVGGLEPRTARARLASLLLPRLQQPIHMRYGPRDFVVDPHVAGVHVDVAGMVSAALARSRSGGLFHRFFRDVRGKRIDVRIPLRVVVSEAAVGRRVDAIEAAVHRKPVSARVVASATAIRKVPSRAGVALYAGVLRRVLDRRLQDPASLRAFTLPTRVVQPKVTTAALGDKYPVFLTVCRGCFQLRLWKHLKLAKVYTIAVGRQGLETPAGLYSIDDRQVNPSWHVPKSAWAGDLAGRVIPPGPADPIKARWLGFWNGAGIHGTEEVSSLGTAASHGCIRMAIPDVIELYDQVPYGTPIYVG
jgi:L,D-transpeptidase catalytic domain/Putative peptidoglycan binding domain